MIPAEGLLVKFCISTQICGGPHDLTVTLWIIDYCVTITDIPKDITDQEFEDLKRLSYDWDDRDGTLILSKICEPNGATHIWWTWKDVLRALNSKRSAGDFCE